MEIASLRAEIARLNKLITILIEQNEAQKEQIAFVKIANATASVGIASANITNGNPNVLNSVSGNLTLSNDNITRLRSVLKKEGFNKVRESGVKNASVLLHVYNKGRGDYKELRKLTGLSNFGMAKYIRSLKKRGLIERDGWQQFKLTAHAAGLIQKAGCVG